MITDTQTKECAFCVANSTMAPEQVLVESDSLYIVAPRGQLMLGFLIIAAKSCDPSLGGLPCYSKASAHEIAELSELIRIVESYYIDALGATAWTMYEQGRAGGGATVDKVGGFPHHAHLCCIPVSLPHQRMITPTIESNAVALSGLSRVDTAYFYIRSSSLTAGQADESVYQNDDRLCEFRFKHNIAEEFGDPSLGSWRTTNDTALLSQTISTFGKWYGST